MIIKPHNLKLLQKELESFVIGLGKKQIKWQQKIAQLSIIDKKSSGIATYADVESERLIIKFLMKLNKKLKIEIPILSEEQAYRDKLKDYDYYKSFDYCWIVDPLDGTNNFANGIDYFSISIGLVKKGRPVLGVIYRPVINETFSAVKGQGCYYSSLHQKRTKIFQKSKAKDFSQLIIGNGFGMKKTLSEDIDREFFMRMLRRSRAVRRMGSAALDLAFVATGKLDAYWERGLCPWDVVAGLIICEEANVKVSDIHGKKVDPFGKSFLAANKALHKKLIKI